MVDLDMMLLGERLQRRFVDLGESTGKSTATVADMTGKPCLRSTLKGTLLSDEMRGIIKTWFQKQFTSR